MSATPGLSLTAVGGIPSISPGDDLAVRTLKFFSDEDPLSFLRTVDRVLGIEDQFFVPPSR